MGVENTLHEHETPVPFRESRLDPSWWNSGSVEHNASLQKVTTGALVHSNDEHVAQRRQYLVSAADGLDKPLLTVREAACLLNVSECWIRRHIRELPVVRLGRAVRLDSALLLRQTQGRLFVGNRLKTGEASLLK